MIKTKKEVDVLVISLSSPLLVGVYFENTLIKKYESKEKTSDILPMIFDEILKTYSLKNLFYANGPGSFMAIKISYIFLKTLCISLDISLFAADGFCFNKNSPIKSIGNRFFMKKNGNISIEILKDQKLRDFELPNELDKSIFSCKTEPFYVLPAV